MSKLKPRKKLYVSPQAMEMCLVIALFAFYVYAFNNMTGPSRKLWTAFTNNLIVTIEDRDLHHIDIKLEKENIKIEDITDMIKDLKGGTRKNFTTVKDNGTEGVLLEYTGPNPDKVYTIDIKPTTTNTVDIKVETAYKDTFDEQGYKKMTIDSIEELITGQIPSGLFVTVNQVSDTTFKVKIRPINK